MRVTLADVARGAGQHDVANVVGAPLAHRDDVIAVVVVRQRLSAPKAPPRLLRIPSTKLRHRMFARHAAPFELMSLASEGALFRAVPSPSARFFRIARAMPLRVGEFSAEPRTGFLRAGCRGRFPLRPFPEPENLFELPSRGLRYFAAVSAVPALRACHDDMTPFAKNRFGPGAILELMTQFINKTLALPRPLLTFRALLLLGLRERGPRMGDILAAKSCIDSGANVRTGVVGLLRGFITLRTAAQEALILRTERGIDMIRGTLLSTQKYLGSYR